jgi:DDE family transposase
MRRAGAWARRRGRAFSPELGPTLARVRTLLDACSPGLRRWLALNLALLTVAMLQLWRGARSGHGYLTLAALSRALPLAEGEKARSKRLARLVRNPHLVGSAMTPLLIRLALGPSPRGWIPIVLDQTTLRGTPTLLAGVRVAGRILPVAFTCFEYATLRKSQNALEWALLLLVTASLPPGCTPLFVMDRGYARVALLAQLRQAGIPYLVRGRRGTMVRLGAQRLALGRVPHRQGVAVRYPHVMYQDTKREPVDLIIFHDPTFKEPWYLLVPPGSSRQLPTDVVVALYRQRMHIELTFRDWKTHLGIRGLRLEVDIAPRLERLLLALTVAYTLAVLLGAGPAARRVRADCELLRATPRHGTRRRLSALTVGILLLSLTRFAALAARALLQLLAALARGRPAAKLAVCPP